MVTLNLSGNIDVAIVLIALATGLAIAAYNSRERGIRIFLLCCCLLNILAAAKMIYEDYPYAYKLAPSDGQDLEPPYRR